MRQCCSNGGKAMLAMVVVQSIYGAMSLITKQAFREGFNVMVFVVYRQAIATLVLFPASILLKRGKMDHLALGVKGFSLVFLTALIGATLSQYFYFQGLDMTSPSMATAMINLVPAMTFIMTLFLGLEKVKLRSLRSIAKILGTLICIAGAICMALYKGSSILRSVRSVEESWIFGFLFLMGTNICWPLWLILQVPICKNYLDPLSLAVWISFLSTLQSSILTLFIEQSFSVWKIRSGIQLLACLFAGIFGSGVTFYLQAWAVATRGPLFSAIFNPLSTVIATAFSFLILREKLYVGSLVGAVVVIVGLYIVLWGKAEDYETKTKVYQRDDSIEQGGVQRTTAHGGVRRRTAADDGARWRRKQNIKFEMESPDGVCAPVSAPTATSWAEMAGAGEATASLPIDAVVLEKLKRVVIDSVRVDEDCKERARARFQNALYGKLLGKAPPFHVVRSTLLGMWKTMGSNILISELPNGFVLIRCESTGVKEQLLLGGPWAVHGVTLQIAPWQPGFEPAFSKLTRALVWVQLHNLPVDYWDGESLEIHSASIGKLVKVDDSTLSLSRTRFARACFEIDLAVPLKRGFWLEDGDKRTFVMALYERVPNLCFHCGIVGHDASSCLNRRENVTEQPLVDGQNTVGKGAAPSCSSMPQAAQCEENEMQVPLVEMAIDDDPGFGWLHPPRRPVPVRGRGGAGVSAARELHMSPGIIGGGQLDKAGDARHVEPGHRETEKQSHVGWTHRGARERGGRLGRDGSVQTELRSDISQARNVTVAEVVLGGCSGCPVRGKLHQSGDPSSSSLGLNSKACFVDEAGGSAVQDVDGSINGKRKAVSSPPLLLMSSLDQRDVSPNEDHHRALVARVQKAFQSSAVRSEWENLEVDSEMEDSGDDSTLWELQKSMRKDSRARTGIQILGAVQMKKKGKGKKLAGGKGS